MPIVLILLLLVVNVRAADAQISNQQNVEMIGRLTRYAVKPAYQSYFRQSLTEYVLQALDDPDNIQAEAYYEQDTPSVLWLIERWRDRTALERFDRASQKGAPGSWQGNALNTKAETYYVKDLQPLSKQEWRRAPKAEDQPLTVMLFVDAKPGTQDVFTTTYHIALPQFRNQPGVITYQLSRIEGNDTKFVTYEKFRSKEAFQAHLHFPPIKPVLEYLQTSITKQPFEAGLHVLVELPGGNSGVTPPITSPNQPSQHNHQTLK